MEPVIVWSVSGYKACTVTEDRMTRSGRTITNFKQAGVFGRPASRSRKARAIALAVATAAASLVHPLLALGLVGLMLWQALSPER